MRILGVSAFYHDSAAALVVDGRIVAAAQEERFTRRKHDDRFPSHAVRACLDQTGLSPADIDHVAFYEKPFLKFERLLGRPARRPEEPLEPFHMDVAASVQAVTDEIMLRLTRSLAAEFRLPNLCLADGVALNCASNGKVLRDGRFERLWCAAAHRSAPYSTWGRESPRDATSSSAPSIVASSWPASRRRSPSSPVCARC